MSSSTNKIEDTDQSLRESIKEIIRKDFKETVNKAVEQHGERIVEFAEQSKAIHEQSVDAIIACFKDEGWRPIEILQSHGRVWLSQEEVEKAAGVTKKRKCEDVHPDLSRDHGGH